MSGVWHETDVLVAGGGPAGACAAIAAARNGARVLDPAILRATLISHGAFLENER